MVEFFNFWGRAVCHQAAERSFWVGGEPLLVCARCNGLYLSFFLSSALLFFKKRVTFQEKDFFLAIFLSLPLVLDGSFSYLSLGESNNILRFLTGLLAGFSLALLCLPIWKKNPGTSEVFSNYLMERVALLIAALFLSWVSTLWKNYIFQNLLMVLGILLLFFLLNLALLEWLGRKKRLKKAFLYFFSFFFALLEVSFLSYFHFFLRTIW